MPILTPATIRKLSAYILPDRNGYDLPPNLAGPLVQAACWSWAISGSLIAVNDQLSANSLYAAIANINNGVAPPQFLGFNNLSAFFGCAGDFATLAGQQAAAMGGAMGAQNACKTALVNIFATQHNLAPMAAAGAVYTLHMKTRSWFGWDHWGIGIGLAGGRRMIIQTVTGEPMSYACDRMWDENQPETIIGIGQLTADHVALINHIPRAPLMQGRCNCGRTHGWAPSVRNIWHRCRLCGTVFCPVHVIGLGGVLPGKTSRLCATGGCPGRTQPEPWDA